jgi:hypothetical protein
VTQIKAPSITLNRPVQRQLLQIASQVTIHLLNGEVTRLEGHLPVTWRAVRIVFKSDGLIVVSSYCEFRARSQEGDDLARIGSVVDQIT